MNKRHVPSLLLAPALLGILGVVGVLSWPSAAHAKADKIVRYAYDQVWPAAVRFLRLDEGFTIVEKDGEAGYVIFELSEDGKQFRGALELVRIRDDDRRPALRMIVRIEDRPSYMELGILDRLERKLRTELGPPPEPRPVTAPDTGSDAGKDKNKRQAS